MTDKLTDSTGERTTTRERYSNAYSFYKNPSTIYYFHLIQIDSFIPIYLDIKN